MHVGGIYVRNDNNRKSRGHVSGTLFAKSIAMYSYAIFGAFCGVSCALDGAAHCTRTIGPYFRLEL